MYSRLFFANASNASNASHMSIQAPFLNEDRLPTITFLAVMGVIGIAIGVAAVWFFFTACFRSLLHRQELQQQLIPLLV